MQEQYLSAIKNIHKRLEHLESIWNQSNAAEVQVHDLTTHAYTTDLTKNDTPVIDLTAPADLPDLTKDDISVIDLTEEEPIVNSHAREFSWGN